MGTTLNHCVRFCGNVLALACGLLLAAEPTRAQSLEFRWKKEFPKNVSWYARTSAGILLVRSGNSLTALDGEKGIELWALEDARTPEKAVSSMPGPLERGLNVQEVPGMGVVLLNGIRPKGKSERRLVAFNLATGQWLWDQAPLDDLMTVVPLYQDGEIVVVSRRLQKKVYVAEAATAAAAQIPMMWAAILPFPYRFEMTRLNLATGKVEWSMEFAHTYTPGPTSVKALGDHLILYFSNRVLASVDLKTGKLLWEDGSKHIGSGGLPLSPELSEGRLIYVSGEVQAVDPGTQATEWRIDDDLGKVTGLFVHDGLAVVIGEKSIVAVDTATGAERWEKKTHGHTTNLVWNKDSDAVLYADWKGLHEVERTSGKVLLEAPLEFESSPYHLRMASAECVLAIGYHETDCVSLKTGKKLFSEGKLSAIFRGEASLDEWPMPEEGQSLQRMEAGPSGDGEWEAVRRRTMLPEVRLQKVRENLVEVDGSQDAYQTESEDGKQKKIWWIDGKTNKQMVVRPAGEKHDVSRPLGIVYGVKDRVLWAAGIKGN